MRVNISVAKTRRNDSLFSHPCQREGMESYVAGNAHVIYKGKKYLLFMSMNMYHVSLLVLNSCIQRNNAPLLCLWIMRRRNA